jgi:hypothetical protein
MILRGAQIGFGLIMFAVLGAPNAALANYCGPGCHASPSGACVRDGWDQGQPVRNECPAYTRPRPSCGFGMRWDRRKLACFPESS